jgi:hypothetical protein
MPTCPHKQDILKEKNNEKKNTHNVSCTPLRLTIAYLPTQMRCTRRKPMTFVTHDQDQLPIRSNIAYLPTNQSGDTPPKVLCVYSFSLRIRQRCLKLAYMPKTTIEVFHSSLRIAKDAWSSPTCQRQLLELFTFHLEHAKDAWTSPTCQR